MSVTLAKPRVRFGTWLIPILLVMVFVQIAGFLYTEHQNQSLIALRNDTRTIRIYQQAQVDRVEAVENALLAGETTSLASYFAATAAVRSHRREIDQVLARSASQQQRLSLARADRNLDQALNSVTRPQRLAADKLSSDNKLARKSLDHIRGFVSGYLLRRNAEGDNIAANIAIGGRAVFVLQLLGGAISLFGVATALAASKVAIREATGAREEIEQLLSMTNLLQSAVDQDDAKDVFAATVERLLPGLGGSLYLYSNSRDRLDLLSQWGWPEGAEPERSFAPANCWAIKSGKPYRVKPGPGALMCNHLRGQHYMLEMPMVARGEIIGLLSFVATTLEGQRRLESSELVIAALADALSLALSALALKGRLQQQASRDPLTGLHNRRHLEDAIQRFNTEESGTHRSLSLAMLDLDHFKALNDKHGHLTGDTVLRAVGRALSAELRDDDVACRFGGEEFAILLPVTERRDALEVAERVRARIEQLSGTHGLPISASVGVATAAGGLENPSELIALADAALYRAKNTGRNRVIFADPEIDRKAA